MAITLDLPMEVETKLKEMAADRGQDVPGLVLTLIAREITAAVEDDALSAEMPLSRILEPIRQETRDRGYTEAETARLMEETLAETRRHRRQARERS